MLVQSANYPHSVSVRALFFSLDNGEFSADILKLNSRCSQNRGILEL